MSEATGYRLISVTVNADRAETVEDVMLLAGALSCTLQDASDHPILEPAPGETPVWPLVDVTGMFYAEVALDEILPLIENGLDFVAAGMIRARMLEDQKWEQVWMRDFAPIEIDRGFWVVPSFATPPEPQATNLIIDPGLAFGSGTHATTLLCLRWLCSQDLRGKRVIDYGCGSGILAIAAARLQAEKVYAVDIDPQACIATRDNAERNGVLEQIEITQSESQLQDGMDVVVANILLAPLLQRVDIFWDLLGAGGKIALSGVLAEQAESLCSCFDRKFTNSSIHQHQEWVLYSAAKADGQTSGARATC